MKKQIPFSEYATNKGGRISSPRPLTKGEPRGSIIRGADDLRIKNGKGGK